MSDSDAQILNIKADFFGNLGAAEQAENARFDLLMYNAINFFMLNVLANSVYQIVDNIVCLLFGVGQVTYDRFISYFWKKTAACCSWK